MQLGLESRITVWNLKSKDEKSKIHSVSQCGIQNLGGGGGGGGMYLLVHTKVLLIRLTRLLSTDAN